MVKDKFEQSENLKATNSKVYVITIKFHNCPPRSSQGRIGDNKSMNFNNLFE